MDKKLFQTHGFASVHSHVFQRVLRGQTQRKTGVHDSFWSWRQLMYQISQKLDPDSLYHVARFAYAELALSGVSAIGEFHYLHHSPNGQPYDNRIAMSEAVIAAAKDIGIRIHLQRTLYERGGFNAPLESYQKRFSDQKIDHAFSDIEKLISIYQHDPLVNIGIAPHSVRALSEKSLEEISHFAKKHHLLIHMHLSEQKKEVNNCITATGLRPVELAAKHNLLSPSFIAIHATHLNDEEFSLLGKSKSKVAICRTTERDLGDGLPNLQKMKEHDINLCIGVDGYASSNHLEEIRALEMDERSRSETRVAYAEADQLLSIASTQGYQALGFKEKIDVATFNLNHPSNIGLHHSPKDALIFAASPTSLESLEINGKKVVEKSFIKNHDEIILNYQKTIQKLFS